jgi:hypothetical protein
VAAQRLRLQTGAAGGALQDPAYAVLVEAAAGGPAMAVNSAECGTIDDAGTGQQRTDWCSSGRRMSVRNTSTS